MGYSRCESVYVRDADVFPCQYPLPFAQRMVEMERKAKEMGSCSYILVYSWQLLSCNTDSSQGTGILGMGIVFFRMAVRHSRHNIQLPQA